MSERFEAPLGYRFAAVSAGIRKGGAADLGLIVSGVPAAAAGVFTTNRVAAAPVVLSREHLRASRGSAQAIVVNAGNANCATPNGLRVARRTAARAAELLGLEDFAAEPGAGRAGGLVRRGAAARNILVASTGVIGVPLEVECIPSALPGAFARLEPDAFEDVARAIMTTDTRPKIAFRRVMGERRKPVRLLGMAKGAGMIHPRMATMLAFVLTDAAVPPAVLKRITSAATARTFNRISVDGDTSTNDTVFVLANGLAGKIAEARLAAALEQVMGELAVAIAADGEGARKLVKIEVAGARSEAQADTIARAIANSPLVKTAIAGGDPNWGRILSAAGASGARFDPLTVSIVLNGVTVCRRGQAAPFNDAALGKHLGQAREVDIRVNLGRGPARARFWTCDLTEDYIRINASYRT